MTQHSMPPTRAEKYWKKLASEIQAATIERCAQVADSFDYRHVSKIDQILTEIAAAIRALKDQP